MSDRIEKYMISITEAEKEMIEEIVDRYNKIHHGGLAYNDIEYVLLMGLYYLHLDFVKNKEGVLE